MAVCTEGRIYEFIADNAEATRELILVLILSFYTKLWAQALMKVEENSQCVIRPRSWLSIHILAGI